MAYLKEDGSLDIERIRKLPIEEKLKELRSLTQEQKDEYWSKIPINEIHGPTRVVMVNYPKEKDGVDAMEFINKMREKYERRK